MKHSTYVIVFDPTDSRFDPAAIKKVLKKNDLVSHWWNHLFNCFVVTSNVSSSELTDLLRASADDVGFLITKADLSDSNGLLPERSWEWIVAREREATSQPSLTS